MKIRLYGMQDVGKRIDHMMELHDLWSGVLGLLTAPGWHNPEEEKQAHELEIALKLLTYHMQNDFCIIDYAKVINELPKNPGDIRNELPPIPKRERNIT